MFAAGAGWQAVVNRGRSRSILIVAFSFDGGIAGRKDLILDGSEF
jgi:hypothetical protein